MAMTLEEKVQRLLDIEDVKQLKLRYARFCDDKYDPDGIASCFTENAIWDGGAMGYAEGRVEIRKLFSSMPNFVTFASHYTTNPIIAVDGNKAEGSWYLWQPMVMAGEGQSMWLGAQYEDTYVRCDDGWLISHLKLKVKHLSRNEVGLDLQEPNDPK